MANGENVVRRADFAVPGEESGTLFVREVAPGAAAARPGVPVLLIHDARVPGLASFDLPVPGGSLATDIAAAGHVAYIMEVRGYGALEDGFYLATGRQLWDASLLRTPTLCIRSGRDFWSRPEDPQHLAEHATDAPVRIVTLPGATHFAHLDHPERGRDAFLRAVREFLAEGRRESGWERC